MSIAGPFGRVIQQRRMSLGLNQEALAERAGVHRTYLSDVERGTRNVTLAILERLAESLEMELSALFELAEGKTKVTPRSMRQGTEVSLLLADIRDQLDRLQDQAVQLVGNFEQLKRPNRASIQSGEKRRATRRDKPNNNDAKQKKRV